LERRPGFSSVARERKVFFADGRWLRTGECDDQAHVTRTEYRAYYRRANPACMKQWYEDYEGEETG